MYKYSVDSCEAISPTTQLIALKSDAGQSAFNFQPGQYAAISFFRKGRPTPARCFSIVSSPTDQRTLQFSMRTKGRFTNALKGLKAGDKVDVRGPFGAFVFEPSQHRTIVLIAGGIGITPLLSMIRYATKLKLQTQITLIYSCRNQDDVPFADELIKLQKLNSNFKIVYVIADGSIDKFSGQTVSRGRINGEWLAKMFNNLADKTYFICGPAGFMKSVQHALEDQGVAGDDILTEAFSQGPNRQTGKIRSWPLNIYSLGSLAVVLGSLVVMASDLAKTLPPSQLLKQLRAEESSESTNSRQADLDQAINQLPSTTSSSSASTSSTGSSSAATSTAPTCVSTPSAPC